MPKRYLLTLFLAYCVAFALSVTTGRADTEKYRLMWRDNPSTTICIGWNQVSGSDAVVYYGTTDYGTEWSSYPSSKSVDRSVVHKGMNNRFARITGLQPNTAYYFVVRDSEGTSARMWFKTAPNDPNVRLSIIAGGDSRNNRTPRQRANKLVSKLRPHVVMFGGDMTDTGSDSQWREWFDDWQLTIGSDGRVIPLIAARGNHESDNAAIVNLFDVPSDNVYYALNLGNNLLRIYTLNTEISIAGDQTTWLENDLQDNSSVSWKIAHYHKPMRPHVSGKSEGNNQYTNWASLFYNHGVKLVVECDAHTVKTTWPVRPSTASGSDEGFVRDDANGTVYVGEGCWGAPLRDADDTKDWTRDSGKFNQFHWIFVDKNKMETRIVKVDNADNVGQVSDSDIFTAPANLDVWNPGNGSVVTINKPANAPSVSLTSPTDGTSYTKTRQITLTANASDSDGSIAKVEFYVNNTLVATETQSPYSVTYTPARAGSYVVFAKAYDNNSNTASSATATITFGVARRISSGADDVEESSSGGMYTNSTDLELVRDGSYGNQKLGLRFGNINIPPGATITKAFIQFTADETGNETTSLTIKGQATDNAAAFSSAANNVSSRSTTTNAASWNPASWNTANEAGNNQQTPELKAIIQEIVNRSGWASGNALALVITGTGKRTAHAYEGAADKAPILYIEYETASALSIRINSSSNDVEENSSGGMYTNSTDIELVSDGSYGNQRIGLRFTNLTIPPGATIARAYLQFTTDETSSGTTQLTIKGEAADHTAAFTSANYNVSSRSTTSAVVDWSPAAWNTTNEAGSSQQTPELKTIIQEIVNRSGWASGNALTLIIIGTGKRTAHAYDGSADKAPLLYIEYTSSAAGGRSSYENTTAFLEPAPFFFSAYPVPFADALTVVLDAGEGENQTLIQLFDQRGMARLEEEIRLVPAHTNTIHLKAADLPEGLYIVQVKINQRVSRRKIMKRSR